MRDAITLHGARIPVTYKFDPSADDDGITPARAQQDRQREEPSALDPLERPKPAGRLVAGPEREAVLDHALEGIP